MAVLGECEADVRVACAACGRTLPSMKRCTQCRAVLYCSRDCQVKHWGEHKESCKRLPQEMRERAHKLAERVKLQAPRWGVEPTPHWKLGADSGLGEATTVDDRVGPGAVMRGECGKVSVVRFVCPAAHHLTGLWPVSRLLLPQRPGPAAPCAPGKDKATQRQTHSV